MGLWDRLRGLDDLRCVRALNIAGIDAAAIIALFLNKPNPITNTGYPGTVRWLACCAPFLRQLSDSLRRAWRSAVQQQQEGGQEMVPSRGSSSSSTPEESTPGTHWHPVRPPRCIQTTSGSIREPSFLSTRSSSLFRSRPAAPPLHPYHIFATTFDMNARCLPLQGGRRDCGETACELPSSGSVASGDMDPVLHRGLEAWIPARISLGAQYHLYVIAVQRCRVLSRLKQIILAHLGGSGRYVLAGSAEIGDVISGRTAILLFARTVDVESRAFRLIASCQKPVVLRGGVRGGIKGVLGMVCACNCFLASRLVWCADPCAHFDRLSLLDRI